MLAGQTSTSTCIHLMEVFQRKKCLEFIAYARIFSFNYKTFTKHFTWSAINEAPWKNQGGNFHAKKPVNPAAPLGPHEPSHGPGEQCASVKEEAQDPWYTTAEGWKQAMDSGRQYAQSASGGMAPGHQGQYGAFVSGQQVQYIPTQCWHQAYYVSDPPSVLQQGQQQHQGSQGFAWMDVNGDNHWFRQVLCL